MEGNIITTFLPTIFVITVSFLLISWDICIAATSLLTSFGLVHQCLWISNDRNNHIKFRSSTKTFDIEQGTLRQKQTYVFHFQALCANHCRFYRKCNAFHIESSKCKLGIIFKVYTKYKFYSQGSFQRKKFYQKLNERVDINPS